MANLQNFTSSDDLNIFIAFHIPNEVDPELVQVKLEHMMEKTFLDAQSKELVSGNDNDHEVIYKIQKPLLLSDKENNKFFENLKSLFSKTSDMSPHFTQIDNSQDNSIDTEDKE